MTTNKKIVIGTIIIILTIITGFTAYKVMNNHQKNLYKVVEAEIIEAARKCYYEKKCKSANITLKELYDLNLLDQKSDPVTKEYYNESSYITVNNNIFKFVVVK